MALQAANYSGTLTITPELRTILQQAKANAASGNYAGSMSTLPLPAPTPAPTTTSGGTTTTRRQRRQAASSGGGSSSGSTTGSASSGPLDSAKNWADAILGGDFSSLPGFSNLTDPKYQDPTQNPYLQAIVGDIRANVKDDWLGNVAALNEQAEAGGRYGSGTYLAARDKSTLAADRALTEAMNQLYGSSYENERNRQFGLANSLLGAQASAAQIPVSIYGIDKQYAAQMAANRLAQQEFAFSKKMQLAQAQQSALNDYFNILAGIGGLGGTTYGTSPGTYVPSPSPVGSALLGGLGGALQIAGMRSSATTTVRPIQ